MRVISIIITVSLLFLGCRDTRLSPEVKKRIDRDFAECGERAAEALEWKEVLKDCHEEKGLIPE